MSGENGTALPYKTESLCPVCLRRVDARRVEREGDIFLEKSCPEHGDFSAVVWRGDAFSYPDWVAGYRARETPVHADCPTDCGICESHQQATCCVLLEVTSHCDQSCSFCFADGGKRGKDPSLEDLMKRLEAFTGDSKPFVYLTGGEPTLRDDLPELIERILAAGHPHVQVNTNGRRLGENPAYAKALAEAGLSFVFMQFDGTNEEIHRAIRGEDLLEGKKRAIENCDAAGLGVTLVPTVVPGVNDQNIGDIIRFAAGRSPAVRGVHFQPVTYLGRYPQPPGDEMRITLPEVLAAIVEQSDGLVEEDSLLPSACDHPLCGFHGDYMVLADGSLRALSSRAAHVPGEESCCCSTPTEEVERNRNFVSRRWKREAPADAGGCCGCEEEADPGTLDGFLSRARSHGFTLTGMAFQDAATLDLERLRRCSLHVVDEKGRVAPFCAHYMTANDGSLLHGGTADSN